MMRYLPTLAAALLAGCAASGDVPGWLPPPAGAPDTWRGRRLYCGAHADVLAGNERDAADAARLLARASGAIAAETGAAAPRCAVLLMDESTPLFGDDPDGHAAALGRWQAAAGGGRLQARPIGMGSSRGGRGAQLDPALAARLLTVVARPDEPELDLPASLAGRAAFAIVAPSGSCVRAAVGHVLDAGLEANDVGWLTRQALFAVADPTDRIVADLRLQLDAALVALVADACGLAPAQRTSVLAALDLPAPAEVDEPAPVLSVAEARAVLSALPGAVWPSAEYPLGAIADIGPAHLDAMRAMDWAAVIDVTGVASPYGDRFGARPRYVTLDRAGVVPNEDDAKRLEALLADIDGPAVICSSTDGAAELLTAHAFWIRGLDAEAAIALGRRAGLDPRLEPLLRDSLRR